MATFHVVENGMTVFRQTGQGVSLVSDPYGKILNCLDSFEEPASEFVSIQKVSMSIASVNTLYPSVGDGVGNVALLGLIIQFIGIFVTLKMKK